MATSEKFANLTENQLVTKETLKDNIFDYLSSKISSAGAQLYKNQGVIGDKLVMSTVDTDATNTTLTISGTSLATDGLGNLFDTDSTYSYCDNVKVHASVSGQLIDVALRYNFGPAFGGSETNVRTNEKNANAVEYIAHREYIGEKGDPDSVSLLGSDITLNVNSLCMSSHSYANRKCLVYLKTPVTTIEATAIQVLNIAWDGVNNTVTVVSNKLGQGTASTTASDYECIVLGPTLSDNGTNPLNGVSPYFFVGTLKAGAVWTSDNTKQNDYEVDLDSIQEEVDKFNRTISVNYTGADFDPGRKTSKPVLTAGHCSAVYGDEIYVFGGSDSDSFSTNTQNAYKYTPSTDTWTALTSMPDAYTRGCSAFTVGSKIYIIGGFNSSGIATANVRIYDTSGDSYSSGSTSGFTAMGRGVGGVIDGKIYYGGGQTELDVSVSTNFYVYDPVGDTWTSKTAVPGNVAGGSFCVYSDKLYVVGGGADISNINENNYTYDYVSDTWASNELTLFDSTNDTEIGSTASDRSYRFTPISWVKDGLMYIYQGQVAAANLWCLSVLHIVDLTAPTRKPVEVMLPYALVLKEASVNIVDGHAFIIGGITFKYYKSGASSGYNSGYPSPDEGMSPYDLCLDLNYVFRATKNLNLLIPSFKMPHGDSWKVLVGAGSLSEDSTEIAFNIEDQYFYDGLGTAIVEDVDSWVGGGFNNHGPPYNNMSLSTSYGLSAVPYSHNSTSIPDDEGRGLMLFSNEDRVFFMLRKAKGDTAARYAAIDDSLNLIEYDEDDSPGNRVVLNEFRKSDNRCPYSDFDSINEVALFKTQDLNMITMANIEAKIEENIQDACYDWYPGLNSNTYKKYPWNKNLDVDNYHDFISGREYHLYESQWSTLGYTRFRLNTATNNIEVVRASGTKDFRVRNFTKNEIYRPLVHFDDQQILIPKGDIYGDIYMSSQWDFEYSIIGGE